MLYLSRIRIRPKLLFLFTITGVIPLLIVASFYSSLTTKALLDKSFDQLITVQDIRKGQIEDFFATTFSHIRVLAESKRVLDFTDVLNSYGKNEHTTAEGVFSTASSLYKSLVESFARPLKNYVATYNYHDLLIIDARHGHVMFSVVGEEDLGSNLNHGIYQDSGLAEVWRLVTATRKTAITDFAPYTPSGNTETVFIGHPIADRDGNIAGVLVLQLSPELVTRSVDSRKGMGETGESYLLGWQKEQNTFELRSNIETMGNGKYVVGFALDNALDYWHDAVQHGTEGGHGTYTDSAGTAVMVSYNRLAISGLDWYLISKIDRYEVTAPIRATYYTISLVAGGLVLLIGLGAILFSRSITRPIIADMEFAQEIADDKLDVSLELKQKDELGDLAISLNNMARNLRQGNWLKTGKEGLDDELRGEHTTTELAKRCITFLVKHMDAQLGALYLQNEQEKDPTLDLAASYAFTDRQGNFNRFQFGEGMIGQAALENEIIIFSDLADNAPAVNYGAAEKIPANFMIIPISFENAAIGVIMIGAINEFTDLQKRFVAENIDNAAILFNAARSREKIRELYLMAERQQKELFLQNEELEEQAKSLKKSEAQLQAQQEELRVTNEELEEQTKALKASESELQAQQEELRVTNEELEERSQALEQQKEAFRVKNIDLVKAKQVVRKKAKDLETANKYKSEFLANMSHELRTPLNSILILSQLMANNRDSNLTEKQVESASTIYSSGSELLSLINEILDLSKIEAGKIELVIEDISTESVVRDTKRIFKDVAADKNVQLIFDVADDVPDTISTDSQRLQQVLRNLMTNAFKFTAHGSVTLAVARPDRQLLAGTLLAPENALAFSVRDKGIGIPKAQQAAIFQAFQQADGGTSRKYGGTGLGLSISKELAKLLGGFIHLKSKEGEGSVFTVVIPVKHQTAHGDEDQTGVPAAEIANESMTTKIPHSAASATEETGTVPHSFPKEPEYLNQGDPERILGDDRKDITAESKSLMIIEDDINFAKILRDFARERGFKCILADSGESGLHLANYYKPSAIILDIGLPGIDGWTVMERLKKNPDLRHIPVHFMSANDSSLDAMRMGAIGYLTKPLSMEKIEHAFSKLEDTISKRVSRLLLVEDDAIQQESIRQLIGNGDVETTAVSTGREAFAELEKGSYDCMILDLGLEDMSGFELLEKIRLSETSTRVPIIIYTGRDLTRAEESKLNQYAESIIVKGVKSSERLLDESALFLHRVEANLPEEKRNMLKLIHNKEAALGDKTILLVDDDMRNVFALSSVLEEKNMNIVIARNGRECLEKLRSTNTIDAILMDIMMPEMDGYEAMQKIRQERKYAKLPIIALTAKAMKGDRSKCIEAGANDYLAKPVNTDKLISMLQVWMY